MESTDARVAAIRAMAAVVAFSALIFCPAPARADAFRWPQPGGPGTPVVLTYSLSNLLDFPALAPLSPAEIRMATAEAFGLWSRFAPLEFYEQADSGPLPSDLPSGVGSYPEVRIGSHAMGDGTTLAHAFLPWDGVQDGLAGDIHFNETTPFVWSLGGGFPTIDFLEVITHEIGHALGLNHIFYADAIMGPYHGYRFGGLGTGYLLAPDIRAIRALYGIGVGSVHPVPEPSTVLLVLVGAAIVFARQRGRLQLRVSWT